MSPAKENDVSSFPPPPLTPLATMYRLPTSTCPSNYDIQVAFHIPMRRYRGHVDTTLDILSPSQTICLNSSNLDLENISLEGEDGRVVVGLVSETNTSIGVVRIDFGAAVSAGRYTLAMDFSGQIRPGLQGVYINRFTDKDGGEKDGISTMFAATEARSFFPCWDQPDVKCSFQLRVCVQRGSELEVLSNMDVIENPVSDEHLNGFVKGEEKWNL